MGIRIAFHGDLLQSATHHQRRQHVKKKTNTNGLIPKKSCGHHRYDGNKFNDSHKRTRKTTP